MTSKFGRRDSLVRQASVDRIQMEGIKRQNTIKHRRELEKSILAKQLLNRLNDDSIELVRSATDQERLKLSVLINSTSESRDVLVSTFQRLLAAGIEIDHVETRPDLAEPGELELFAQTQGVKSQYIDAFTKLCIEKPIDRIVLKKAEPVLEVWYPKHISDLDKCAHVVVKYEPTEDPKHPGYGDKAYIKRRAELNAIANSYKYGQPMPHIEYTELENNTWRQSYAQLKQLRQSHTCIEYQRNVKKMEDEGVITMDKIPQLSDLNVYVQKKTGFQLRPCGGLLSARDFLASLAFRTFQATLYVRHHSKPHHCPEPDVIHEVLGHVPMFADPNMAQLSQEIGLLSLGASDEQIERLATVYWFIVEFGLCQQEGGYRAIGAGLISAFGELQHACSNVPQHEEFDPKVVALKTYEDSDYQPLYFVAHSITDAMNKLRKFAQGMPKSLHFTYDPYTQTVVPQKSHERIKREIKNLMENMESLTNQLKQMM
ncbi:unnamed protein product [Bursaphelenchus okinawaensis]|uniref:Biopterin-dependent aromatic amino acid hydroxylase family profile domain-containing protein n=1 Tax=Bursaphelenchus okinawaensis TaxID=465554 RepID=A0A811K8Q0_9BILA|nr:unnamed protein product [Bursaphelenchus okinawaensis]CAG9093356.1 unnamed protein product [Bursaphelenchus okinawaensis]